MANWIDLGEPVPREHPENYLPYEWPIVGVESLPLPMPLSSAPFLDLLSIRRTERVFGSLTITHVADLLWHTFRGQGWGDTALGFPLSLRPIPSAGAIHPIHIVVNFAHESNWRKYSPRDHSFEEIDLAELQSSDLRARLQKMLPSESATIIWFIAEPGKTFAKYHSANSLVWRDAGILQGIFAIAASSLNLNFCPMGTTGDSFLTGLDEQRRLVGVGVGLLGSKTI